MQQQERFELTWNLEILGFDRGKKRSLLSRTHNIVINNGRQFVMEVISASAFSAGAGFTRAREAVVRYVGFGIGGTRQIAPEAATTPLSDNYPAGYAGGNDQTDADVTVTRLERPVKASPAAWLKQIAAPPVYPTPTSVRWTAFFDEADINLAPVISMPVAEVGLYSSLADPSLPNGGTGAYPGATNHMLAYDTFQTIYKTGFLSLQVNWTWQI
jgi:hypothetical protein